MGSGSAPHPTQKINITVKKVEITAREVTPPSWPTPFRPARLQRVKEVKYRDIQTRRRAVAQRDSSCRLDSCSLRSTDDTWVSTVFTEMNSSLAISL